MEQNLGNHWDDVLLDPDNDRLIVNYYLSGEIPLSNDTYTSLTTAIHNMPEGPRKENLINKIPKKAAAGERMMLGHYVQIMRKLLLWGLVVMMTMMMIMDYFLYHQAFPEMKVSMRKTRLSVMSKAIGIKYTQLNLLPLMEANVSSAELPDLSGLTADQIKEKIQSGEISRDVILQLYAKHNDSQEIREVLKNYLDY